MKEARLIIEGELIRREWGPARTMQMYCLKQLKQKMDAGVSQFKESLKLKYAQHVKWIEELESLHEDQENAIALDSYPHI